MLARVLDRVARATSLNVVIVATTTDPSDDPVQAYCEAHDISVFRGSMYDVLDRFYRAAAGRGADVVVRITADCPLIDPEPIGLVVQGLTLRALDFACNRLPPPWHRTFPIGLDAEACSFAALERAWREARPASDGENVQTHINSD